MQWILDKGMIHVLGEMAQDDARFHYTTQNSVQIKTYELFLELSIYYF